MIVVVTTIDGAGSGAAGGAGGRAGGDGAGLGTRAAVVVVVAGPGRRSEVACRVAADGAAEPVGRVVGSAYRPAVGGGGVAGGGAAIWSTAPPEPLARPNVS